MKYKSLNELNYVDDVLVHTNTLLCKSSLLKLPWDIYFFHEKTIIAPQYSATPFHIINCGKGTDWISLS